jgi:histidinol phosphatase-like enzyme (inositol monophosphatase family)
MNDFLSATADLSRLAGDVAMRHFRRGVAVETKGDGSPVTVADREAEQAARAWIEARFPADGIHGEEFGLTRPDAPRRWVIDPIDGTKSFVRGVPLWGSMVAVCEGETVLAGAICFPGGDARELIAAAPGEGCWHDGVRCRVSSVSSLGSATVLTTDDRFLERPDRADAWRQLSHAASVSRTWGDCYGYLLVATGRAEVMTDPVLAPWDAAPLQPIIEEAGGVFTSWKGTRSAFGGDAIATNLELAKSVRLILQAT